MKKNDLVFPGSYLAAEEEFVGGENTFDGEEGGVYSDCIGTPSFDDSSREVSVNKFTPAVKPVGLGTIVTVVVTLVKEKMALVEIREAEKDGEPRKILNCFALIQVFNAKNSFVRHMRDAFRVGDVVKAKVTEITPYSISLSTNEPELGVIKGYCIKCRQPLHLFGENLKCVSCGYSQSRKISRDYMLK